MDIFNRAIDVAKDIINEAPKDFRAIQNTGQMIMPGGSNAMAAVRQMTKGHLGGDDVRRQSAEQNFRDIGRASLAVGSLLPAGAGVKAGTTAARAGAATIRGSKNLKTHFTMARGLTRDIRKIKHNKLLPRAEKKALTAPLKRNRKVIVSRIPGQAKWTAKQAARTVGYGGKSSALLVPATSPRDQAGVSKRKRLAKSTHGAIKTTYKTVKKIGGIII